MPTNLMILIVNHTESVNQFYDVLDGYMRHAQKLIKTRTTEFKKMTSYSLFVNRAIKKKRLLTKVRYVCKILLLLLIKELDI